MKFTHTIGLILFCMLFSFPMHASAGDNNEQDYNEEYDDEEYDYSLDDLLKETEQITTTTTTTTTQIPIRIRSSTSQSVVDVNIPQVSTGLFIELPNKIYQCPQQCTCNYEFTLINCTMNNLDQVPHNLSDTIEQLDLSSNRISHLDQSDFENYSNLKELILDSNNLESVNFENISGLRKLEYLSLVNNHIAHIDPNAFSTLVALKTLNLSRNPIEISSTITNTDGEIVGANSFLNHPNLRELNLNGCKVSGIYENMLKNTSGLMALDLGNNEFNEPIDTQAFVTMKNLVKLKLPELKRNTVTQLCKTLTTIDAISLPAYDVSCFELESGSSFDDSTIRTGKFAGASGGGTSVNILGSGRSDSSGVAKPFASRDEPNTFDRSGEKSINAVEEEYTTRKSRPSGMEPSRRNRTQSEMIVNSTTPSIEEHTGEPDDAEDYKVSISSQTINQILLGIIIVAVAGIIIGIICRRDICGVKTKMCRTRRPPPTDQVRPAEEIPLNKV